MLAHETSQPVKVLTPERFVLVQSRCRTHLLVGTTRRLRWGEEPNLKCCKQRCSLRKETLASALAESPTLLLRHRSYSVHVPQYLPVQATLVFEEGLDQNQDEFSFNLTTN